MLALLGSLGAILLALRFNVIVLVPAILFGWVVALVNGMVSASSGSSIIFQMALIAVALQFGFVGALLIKWAMLVSRRQDQAANAALPDGTF